MSESKTKNTSVTLVLSLSLSSLALPGVLLAPGGADGECDPRALSDAPADPGRGVHAGRPPGEHLETGEPLPEPQRMAAEAGDPHQGTTQELKKL